MFWRRKRKEPEPPQPVCGCGHHLSFHDPVTSHCGHVESVVVDIVEVVRTKAGNPVLDTWGYVQKARTQDYRGEHTCGCKRYIGPEPLTAYYAPEIVP